jgi:hypothetical protein
MSAKRMGDSVCVRFVMAFTLQRVGLHGQCFNASKYTSCCMIKSCCVLLIAFPCEQHFASQWKVIGPQNAARSRFGGRTIHFSSICVYFDFNIKNSSMLKLDFSATSSRARHAEK